MIGHPEAEVLSAYLDSATTAEERRRVDAHLSSCAACRQHLGELKVTADLVHGLNPIPVPEGFRENVHDKLQHRFILHWLPRLPWPLSWRVFATATALVLVGVFSVNLLQQLQSKGAPLSAQRSFEGREAGGALSPQGRPDSKSLDNASRAASQVLGVPASGHQVIRTASLIADVHDVDEAASTLIRIAESMGGFVANSTLVHQHPSYGTFELRIPVRQFTRALEQVERVGQIHERHISGQDVTEEFVDLTARVRNLERHEHQLLTFMDRATRVTDLLAIEQELARVRGEIEQLTGRLRLMSNQVELATVNVTLRESSRGTPGLWDLPASLEKIQASFINTVRQILLVAERLVIFTSALVPVALLAFPTWMLIRWHTRRRSRLGDEQKEH